ncbi:P-loop containing nucleoside triphosphate hydrolase protein [Aspergillus pseudonomiae]|uniref:P-loop containing nucleoside triphosphate hydrolase protein n=1 Tax=Aspergillus pseudonomiae TaxID=1506151 RepID=A0A5N6HKD4_9EURO|nr:P-loop containing nucleoside triphosphate hydrolase protein [Aspergillus pseudonomiae]KAB8254971.1 P-loop containing nucleoside triphosphate hydrolase protein [Aspergillus pseudonomiae]KAE8409393.1 P-loop containing nucleoside triphosphate hydrolase protein [Aspergillus pseudonomiae]
MANGSTVSWAEDALGPVSHVRGFDFTLTFEQVVLSIIPSIVLLLAGPSRLLYLTRCRSKTCPQQKKYLCKLVTSSINLVLQLSLLVLWSVSPSLRTSTTIPAASLSLANAIVIIGLSYIEDRKSTKPSSLLTIYLLLSILSDAVQVRTLWLTHRIPMAAVQSAITGTKLAMLLLEMREKTSYLQSPYRDYPPEATSGIVNLSFIWWINRLFMTGYRKLMGNRDLYDLEPGLASGPAGERLKRMWEKHGSAKSKLTLPWVFVRCFWMEFLAVVWPRVCLIGFSFAQPFLIMAAVQHVERPVTTENRDHGYGLIGATVLVYLGIAFSNVHYRQRFSRVSTLFRGAMIVLIHDRTLTLQDDLYTESAALTLMSTDVDGIIEHLENMNDIWARTIEVTIGITLLGTQLGATCIVPLLLTLACLVGQKLVANSIGHDQQNWNLVIQKRVKNTSAVLGTMKAIKVSGLSKALAQNLQEHRERELFVSRAFFKGIMWLNGLATLPRIWSPVITFTVYAIQARIQGDDSLTTVRAFTALSIITLVTTPAEKLLTVLPQLAAALGCFQRIHEYITSDPVKDGRLGRTEVLTLNSAISSANVNEKGFTPRTDNEEQGIAIELDNVTVLPSPKAISVALKNVSFKVRRGNLLVVTGSVGSGKTTLLKTILGELGCQSGTVCVESKRISYCSQNPWLLNTTIKKSITGLEDHKVDEKWYQTVIRSCCLEEDIHRWPYGDQSKVGSKGLTLSGGQKQRVALARAVYSRQDIALLDDTLSALDMQTQEMIIARLLSNDGIFRQLGITVILTTHSPRLLKVADSVISLSADGQIELQTTGKDAIQYAAIIRENEDTDAGAVDPNEKTWDKAASSSNNAVNEVEDDDRTRQIGDLSVYYYYARIVGPSLCTMFLLAHALLAFAENFPRVWLSKWTEAGGSQLPLYLSVYIVLALAASVLVLGCIWVIFLNLMPKSAIRLHWRLLNAVIRAPLSFFSTTDSGVTLNRFSQDMTLVDLALPISLMSLGQSFFGCITTVGLIATGSAYMAITIPVTLVVLYILQKIYLKTSRQLRYLDLECRSPLYSHFVEVLDGLPTIRAFGWQVASTEVLIQHLDQSQKPYYMLLCVQRWLNLVLDIVVTALATIVVTLAVELHESTNAGLLGVALNNILGFNQLLSFFITAWTTFETSLGAIARVKSFVETTPSEVPPGQISEPPACWPEQGAVHIQGLSLSYPNGTSALHDISMRITPGERIGICGRTGSGKSSFILALLRLVNLSHGTITIDGLNIESLSPSAIREALIAVPQDPFTLLGSVRYNADIMGISNDEDITSILKQVGIWEAIESRGGLDAILEDHPLSQGEQQLFCLARAILKKRTSQSGCQVLILDEATSNLDSETDRRTQQVLKDAFNGCTFISVAHRLDTIINFDRIAVLDAGRLVEFDTPQRLLARDGLFRRMVSAVEEQGLR